jgi:hypothetical protein
MVSTVTSYTDSRNKAVTGQGNDGVVMVSTGGGYYGTGVLLYGGQAILTAAHLFNKGTANTSVTFETTAGKQTLSASKVSVLSNYDSTNLNNDLAIVWLNGHAPVGADRYDLYRDSNEIGQTMTMVGYGVPGTGAAGVSTNYSAAPIRQIAYNTFDADAAALKAKMGGYIAWNPKAGTQLLADFDDGTTSHDALGRLLGNNNVGLGQKEGIISSGDSGGPAFINGKIAGIASSINTMYLNGAHPDVDNSLNSSYGEIGAWQRVSAYQEILDKAIRASYTDAPTKLSEVKQNVLEGSSGATNAYFLVEYTGTRSDPNQVISLNYATRNGTAKAGEDYLATKGTLNFYAGETQAVVAVEVLGDYKFEANETFYMDFSTPGANGQEQIIMSGMRTIINDDIGLFV